MVLLALRECLDFIFSYFCFVGRGGSSDWMHYCGQELNCDKDSMGLAVFSKTRLGGFTASSCGPGADVCWWCVQKPLSAASWMTAAWDCSSLEPSCWNQEGGDDGSTRSTEVLGCCAVAGAPLSDYTRPSQAQIFCTCLCVCSFFFFCPLL